VFIIRLSCERKTMMIQAAAIDSAIHQQLALVGACSLDDLAAQLPGYSWAQVFAAVDRLTREGAVTLTNPAPRCYLLLPVLPRSTEAPLVTPV
jgi:hypothetical protein